MADKRTHYPIPADTWTKIIDGEVSASVYQEKTDVTYYSMSYDDSGDTPADVAPSTIDTAEKMFRDGSREQLDDSVLTYIWVRCAPGEVGSLIVTL